ncbi:hypothetical protein K3495_g14870 [Podosphaera aphanis]|nr:hypothetical protein K3495_g14870 [Podosphaera aphanis]
MSAANILKSMKYTLSLFEVEDYILEDKDQLVDSKSKAGPEDRKAAAGSSKSIEAFAFVKQDRNIRVAISQLVPDIAFHLVGPSYTAKQCWDNLKQFNCPNSDEDIDDLTQAFWGLQVEDDVDVDEFVQKLAEIRGRITLIDSSSTASDSSMKKRILTHFIKCCGGFYMSTVISLKDPAIQLVK